MRKATKASVAASAASSVSRLRLQSEAAAGCCGFVGGPYLDETYFGEGMAIAVRPEDGDLRRALDAALQAIQADGRYGELYLRYFPISAF